MKKDKPENEFDTDVNWDLYYQRRANELKCSIELAKYIYKLETLLNRIDKRFEYVENHIWNILMGG